jgi:hypothetical protein
MSTVRFGIADGDEIISRWGGKQGFHPATGHSEYGVSFFSARRALGI